MDSDFQMPEEMIDESNIEDTSIKEDQGVSNAKYDINSYGADYTVDSLVKRIVNDDIYIPPFQRGYVWNINQASRFIESLLLGLPVPGIFLSKDEDRRLLVIDGQQRLRTLERFYSGLFDKRGFELKNVREDFKGLTYQSLKDEDRRLLDDTIIHATIVQQMSPQDDDSSIYQIFERLNTGGSKLQPQEIRASIYHGKFIRLLDELNEYPAWRNIYGPKNKREKDQELILRFLALFFAQDQYRKPLNEFLNSFTHRQRHLDRPESSQLADVFKETIDVFDKSIGKDAFRSQRVLNVAVFDSMMVGLARRLQKGDISSLDKVKQIHNDLIRDEAYASLYTRGTTDEQNIADRIRLATRYFDSAI